MHNVQMNQIGIERPEIPLSTIQDRRLNNTWHLMCKTSYFFKKKKKTGSFTVICRLISILGLSLLWFFGEKLFMLHQIFSSVTGKVKLGRFFETPANTV